MHPFGPAMSEEKPAHTVAHYWDVNRETSRDPTYWMAHPLCREAINRRVTGSPHEWPLDWFRRVHAARPFARGVSWGCGLGAFERSALRAGLVREIDAFDISPASVEDARREAETEGIGGIRYAVGDFDDPRVEPGRYDIVLFHASLHHVARLGQMFRRLARALPAGAAIYVDEYVGPSSDDWSDAKLAAARRLLAECPESGRTGKPLEPPVNKYDISEAIRSGEIRRYLRDYLDVVEWRPYGGQLAGLIFPYLNPDWLQAGEGRAFVRRLMDLEDAELARDPEAAHHLVALGRLKDAARLPGLPAQAWRALRRRLHVVLTRLRFGLSRPPFAKRTPAAESR
jgi:SAM-dependent methyltransferase